MRLTRECSVQAGSGRAGEATGGLVTLIKVLIKRFEKAGALAGAPEGGFKEEEPELEADVQLNVGRSR